MGKGLQARQDGRVQQVRGPHQKLETVHHRPMMMTHSIHPRGEMSSPYESVRHAVAGPSFPALRVFVPFLFGVSAELTNIAQ